MHLNKKFNPGDNLLGSYHELDGTIEFYGRINSFIKNTDKVLDLGAGRGSWYSLDNCSYRRDVRDIKNKVGSLIGADIDNIVMQNPSTHKNIVMSSNKIPLEDNSIDVIIADWVLEHIENDIEFTSEIDRVLKPGGVFCARTPHKYKYVSIFARIFNNKLHSKILKFIQPDRVERDIFPTKFNLNTLTDIKKNFLSYKNYSYLYASHPSYFAGNKYLFNLISFFHKVLPSFMVSEIFVFLKKNNAKK